MNIGQKTRGQNDREQKDKNRRQMIEGPRTAEKE